MSFFPVKKQTEALIKQGKLNAKTKIEVRTENFKSGGLKVVCMTRRNPQVFMVLLTSWLLAIGTFMSAFMHSLPAAYLFSFVYVIAFILFAIGIRMRRNDFSRDATLGFFGDFNYFILFLNKFGRANLYNCYQGAISFLSFRLIRASAVWQIEYGLLISACDLYQKDPAAFGRVVRNARNKKELRQALGVR